MNARIRLAALATTLLAASALALAPAAAPAATAAAVPAGAPRASLTAAPAATLAGAARGVDLAHLQLGLSSVAAGFTNPLYVANAADGSGRLFVVEQGGLIKVVRGGVVSAQPFLDVSSVISKGGERGLLGLAFAPGYATNGRFYINFTDSAGNTQVQRCIASDPASDAPVVSRKTILFVKQPYANHNGGCLQFGPDRYLYIGMGDGGSAGDPGNRAQSHGVLLGKMLRIDTGDRVSPATYTGTYTIPKSNPFYSKKGYRKEIWAIGLRNPWRFSFDNAGGKLWIGDVGQDKYEEIDVVSAAKGGQNYGWHVWEGNHRYTKKPRSVSRKGYTFPIAEYKHPSGETVTGGYVYRGAQYPAMYGTYIYADYVDGWIGGVKRFSTTGAALKTPQRAKLLSTGAMIASFGVGENSELYACDWSHGVLYQVTATTK
jgi:glucose/arabinose dehydrogenase